MPWGCIGSSVLEESGPGFPDCGILGVGGTHGSSTSIPFSAVSIIDTAPTLGVVTSTKPRAPLAISRRTPNPETHV